MPPRLDLEAKADDGAGPAPAAAPENVAITIVAPLTAPEGALSPEVERVLSLMNKCVADLKSVCDKASEIAASLQSSTISAAERRGRNEELKEQVDDFIMMKKLTRTFRGAMRQYIDAVVSGNTQIRAEMRRVINTAAVVRSSADPDNVFNHPMREFMGMSAHLQRELEPKYATSVAMAEGQLFTMLDVMAKGLDEVSRILDDDAMMGMTAAALTAELVRASGLTGDDGITLEETREIQQRRHLRSIGSAFKLFVNKMEAVIRTINPDLGPGLWMQQSKKPCCGKPVLSATEIGLSAGVSELMRALQSAKAAYLSVTGVEDKHVVALRKACQRFYQLPLERIIGVETGQSEAAAIVACRDKLDELLFAETLPDRCKVLLSQAPQGRSLTSGLNSDASGAGGLTGIFQVFTAARDWASQAGKWLSEVAALLPRIQAAYGALPQDSEESKMLLRNYNLLLERSINIRLHAAAYGLLPPADTDQVVADTACLRDEAVRAIAAKYAGMDTSRLNALQFDEVFQGISPALKKISASHVTLLQLIPLAVRALDTTERLRRSGLEFDTVTSHYGNIYDSFASYAARIQQAVGKVAAVLTSGWSSKEDLRLLPESLRDALTVIRTCVDGLELFCQDLKVWRGLDDDAAPVRVIGEITAALTEQHTIIEGLLRQFRDNNAKMPQSNQGDAVLRSVGVAGEMESIKRNTALIGELRDTIQALLPAASSGAANSVFSEGRIGVAFAAAEEVTPTGSAPVGPKV